MYHIHALLFLQTLSESVHPVVLSFIFLIISTTSTISNVINMIVRFFFSYSSFTRLFSTNPRNQNL
ncbi:hypothetical protein HanIR_Chr08g0350741 [Helianthus annuus]|nr:hypothetical protein HanIR_Chr08g0350741 [Helianthus annuus]